MKAFALSLTVLTAFAFSAFAAPKVKTVADTLDEEQALIVKVCKPTDQQQAALKEAFKAKLTALEAWDKANGEKLKAADDAAKAARSGNDDAAKRKAGTDQRELHKAREAAATEADKAVLAALNDQQKVALAGEQMAAAMLKQGRYKKANLTAEQEAKIRSACTIAAGELAGISGDDKKSKQARTSVQKSVKWAVENVILTDEQRAGVKK